MKVLIPNNNIEERKYIIDILLNEFLGLEFLVVVGNNSKDYEIVLENGNKLMVEDHFFNKFSNDLGYLKEENIPKNVKFSKNDFCPEADIPIIYGTSNFQLKTSSLTCGLDIFASSFFMLTRWEEYVNKTRDKHNRFSAYTSLSYKNNFLDRPIVNEYVEMLWNMLKFLGCKQERKKRKFEFVLTHDVDHAYKYASLVSGFREILGCIIKRKDLSLAYENSLSKLLTHLNLKKDPFDTYGYLMDISEQVGVRSYFFLHSSNYSKYDSDNDNFLKTIAQKVLKRGHFLGYHPSYNSYNNLEIFMEDKERIENIIECKLTSGRQHYLRFEVPTTWQVWEEAKMKWDSTLSYADKEGFRCGVCYPYSVFNIILRKKLNLKEKPLIAMEGSFTTYQPDIAPKEMRETILKLIKKVKKYNGEFVFLWHNSNFNTNEWLKYKKVYESIIK